MKVVVRTVATLFVSSASLPNAFKAATAILTASDNERFPAVARPNVASEAFRI